MAIKLNEYLNLNSSLCRTLAYGMKPLLSGFSWLLNRSNINALNDRDTENETNGQKLKLSIRF
jgi:hypothetical protein